MAPRGWHQPDLFGSNSRRVRASELWQPSLGKPIKRHEYRGWSYESVPGQYVRVFNEMGEPVDSLLNVKSARAFIDRQQRRDRATS